MAPRLVVLLGVLLDVIRGKFLEGPSSAFRSSLGKRIAAGGDFEHHLRCQLTSIGQADGSGIAEMEPVCSAVTGVDHLEGLLPGGLNPQRQPVLVGIPDGEGHGLRLDLADVDVAELVVAGGPGLGPVFAWSRHLTFLRINPG